MSDVTEGQSDGDSPIKYITSNFVLHKFNAVIGERKIIYQVIKMKDSVLIFINDKDNMQLSSMFVSLISRYDNLPTGTRLFGNFRDEGVSKGIANRWAKRLNKTVFVSCNLEVASNLLPKIEQRMDEEIKANPDMF